MTVRDLHKEFGRSRLPFSARAVVRAVDGVSFDVHHGEVFGLVGESGSGKTTIGRMIVRLLEPTSGTILYRGRDVLSLSGPDLLAFRRQVQMVFQNPHASLNPRRRIRDLIRDPLEIHRIASGPAVEDRIVAAVERVGLAPDMLDRYPHEFSSGQRQRIGLARCLAVEPSFVVADEPVSALDVSIQAQVLNLLRDLRGELGLTILFITHDLRAVRFLCDRIAVLYLGRIAEISDRDSLIAAPLHPYTRALISSLPTFDLRGRGQEIIVGELSQEKPDPAGCVFAPRCDLRRRLGSPGSCTTERPVLREVRPGHSAACHFADADSHQ